MIRTYKDSVCLITGGASGIGAALGRELSRRGARVALADRQVEEAAALASEITQSGGRASGVALDVREPEAFDAVVSQLFEEEGRIDYLFNNAGIGVGGPFEEHTLDDWRYIMDVNVMGVLHGVRAVYPRMQQQGFGHIVNTASMAGQIPTPGLAAYGTTKHAVVGLSRSLRVEAAEHGVRVSALCPGPIRTAILDKGGKFGRVVGWAGIFEPTEPDDQRAMDVGEFAKLAVDQISLNREIIILPGVWKVMRWLDRLPQPLSDRLYLWMQARMRAEIEKRARAAQSGV